MKFKNPFKEHIVMVDNGSGSSKYLIRKLKLNGWNYFVGGWFGTNRASKAKIYHSLEQATEDIVVLHNAITLASKKNNPKVLKRWWI